MYCRKCGYKNEDDAKYCRKCGTYIWVEEPVEEPVKEEISEEPVEKKTMLPEEPIQQEQRTNASEDKQEKPAEEMQTPGTKEREESRDKKEQEAEDKTEKGKVPQNMWQPDEHLEPIETKIDGTKEKSRVPAMVVCVIGIIVVIGLIIACVWKQQHHPQDINEADKSSELSTEIVETTAATTEQVIDMSSYQTQLDQWKSQFANYSLSAATQPTYDATVAQYEVAIAEQNVDGCNQCETAFAALLEQVKQESYVITVRRNYYAGILERIYYLDTLPDDGDDIQQKMADDHERYAVYDIDSDGIEELMVVINRPETGAVREIIYEYNVDNDSLNRELYTCDGNKHYNNGKIIGWDLDANGDVVNIYNPEDGTYSNGYVIAYRDSMNWINDDVIPPTDCDYRVFSFDHKEDTYMTEEEYNQWLADQTAGATELEIPWKKIVDEEYREYAKAYSAMMLENVKAHLQEGQNDIGVSYIEGGDSCEAAETMLSSIMAVSYDDESGDMVIGSLDGKEFYIGSREDATGVIYQKKAIDNLTLLGLYPGMKKEDAVALIKEYGFHKFSDHAYCTGDAFGSYVIYLDCKKGKVKSIQLNPFCGFAG
ncbi:MAG TPA: hypothetical protein DHV96_11955 [Lachnospiraceae bacterium]|nr:hypothetical protein [Lachnospiraceae bacterium]